MGKLYDDGSKFEKGLGGGLGLEFDDDVFELLDSVDHLVAVHESGVGLELLLLSQQFMDLYRKRLVVL